MNLPKLKKTLELPYYDSHTYQFQIKENGSPVDITSETLIFYLKKKDDETFTPITKNIGTEGWFVDPENGIFNVIIDTQVYIMEEGYYEAEVEWEDRKISLVFIYITVFEDIRNEP